MLIRVKLFFLLIFLSAGEHLLAQQQMTYRQFRRDSSRIMKPLVVRPLFRFDNRFSLKDKQILNIRGYSFGVIIKEKIYTGLGYYRLYEKLNTYTGPEGLDITRTYEVQYGSLNTEFLYRTPRYYSLGIPVNIGFGENVMIHKDQNGNITQRTSSVLAITEIGFVAAFKPIRWIGLKALFGYRTTTFNKIKEYNFDGLFATVGVIADLFEIQRDVRMYFLYRKYKRSICRQKAFEIITD
jgi:hypothetical protein